MEDQSQLTLDRLFESVLQVCRMSHLPKSLSGPVAFADLPRMSRLYFLDNQSCIIHIKKFLNINVSRNGVHITCKSELGREE